MKRKISALILIISMLSLCACGNGNPSKTDNAGGSPANAGNASSSQIEIPFGLVSVSDTGDGKLVFIIDTALIDDDLSGAVQCSLNFGDYSVNYIVWDEYSINCDLSLASEEDGKRVRRPVVNGEYEFIDGKLMISFNAAEVYATDFKYAGVENSYFQVYRDDGRRISFPIREGDIIVNSDTTAQLANLTNDYGIGYKSSSFDLQYFTPATDDYIITVFDNADSMGNPTQTNALFSFNDAGECVQYVVRNEIPVDTDLGTMDVSELTGENGYYQDNSICLEFINDNACGGKAAVISGLTSGYGVYTGYPVEEGYREGSVIYCSRPLDKVEMKGSLSGSDVHLDTISAYLGELNVGSDYEVLYSTDKIESRIDTRTLIIGGKMVTDGNNAVEQEYRWPEVNWEKWLVTEYDIDGYKTKQYSINVFENSDAIAAWCYTYGGLNYNWEHPEYGPLRYPEYQSDSPIDVAFEGDYMDFLDEKFLRLSDNVLCHVSDIEAAEDAESRRSQHKLPVSVYGGVYYSIPGVNERQLDALDMIWEYHVFVR